MLKKAIRGRHFDSVNKVIDAAHTFFNSLSQEDYQCQVAREDRVVEVMLTMFEINRFL